jgi:hypothetical protein
MAKINKVMVGESLVGDGNEVAHIDLILGPRGSAAETAFCNALTNNKDGFTTLLAVIAPNLPCKPNTILYNKVTIKDARQAVQMLAWQYRVARPCRTRSPRRIPLLKLTTSSSASACSFTGKRRQTPRSRTTLSRGEGIHRTRHRRQADRRRGDCSAQLRASPVRCEDLKRKPSTAG